MNNLLRFFYLSIMVLSSVVLVSCGDDDDDDDYVNNSSIVGVWKSETRPFVESEDETVVFSGSVYAYFWYKENGSFVEVDVITENESEESIYYVSEKGKWSVKGNTVTQTTNFEEGFGSDDEFDTDTFEFKINGNTMLVTYKDEEIGEVSVSFQRVTEGEVQDFILKAKRQHHLI